jgi:hypothetical protein
VKVADVNVLTGPEGIRLLDRHGARRGLRSRLLRIAQLPAYEGVALDTHEQALREGHHIIYIPVRGEEQIQSGQCSASRRRSLPSALPPVERRGTEVLSNRLPPQATSRRKSQRPARKRDDLRSESVMGSGERSRFWSQLSAFMGVCERSADPFASMEQDLRTRPNLDLRIFRRRPPPDSPLQRVLASSEPAAAKCSNKGAT